MSFDLMVLINQTDANTQKKWAEKLKAVGIACQFPKEFSLAEILADENDSNETTIQYQFTPPLVKTATPEHTSEINLEPWPLDDDSKNELIESIEDKSLQHKIAAMKFELQLSSSAGRDDHALILQCFAAATLADACDGLLVDPQEFGTVDHAQIYAVVQHHCQYEINKLNGHHSPLKAGTITKPIHSSIAKPTNMWAKLCELFKRFSRPWTTFNSNAISVNRIWEKEIYAQLPNAINQFCALDQQKNKEQVSAYLNKSHQDKGASLALQNGLMLSLIKNGHPDTQFYIKAVTEIGKKVYLHVDKHNANLEAHPDTLANLAGFRLKTYVSMACAKTFQSPSLPCESTLIDGIEQYHNSIIKLADKPVYKSGHGIQANILFVVMALLANKNKLALFHLKRNQAIKSMCHHRRILLNLTTAITQLDEHKVIQNANVEKDFFILFNGYRMPSEALTGKSFHEMPILPNPIGGYVFTWLYLKLFKGQTETTWKELRNIMMW